MSAGVAAAALLHGVSRSSVWEHLRRGRHDQARLARARWTLSDDDRTELYQAGGNIAAAARARRRDGATSVSARTMQRAVAQDTTAMERTYMRAGWRAARGAGLFRQLPDGHRNREWQTDHKQLAVTVVLPDGSTGKPWITAFIDVATRVVQGWAIDLRPTGTTATCALRHALTMTPFAPSSDAPSNQQNAVRVADSERAIGYGVGDAVHGGVPERVRFDNGREFLARAMQDAFADLVITPVRCAPYTPHLKGRVERWHRTLDDTLLAGLPFFADGAQKIDGSLYSAASTMLTLNELVARVASWIDGYHDRPHSGLRGLSPRQAWNLDPTPLRVADEEQLRGLLHRERRVIGKYGIRVNNVFYLPPRLFGSRQQVEVRYDVHAPTELLVYIDGRHVDTAFPQHTATAEQLERFYVEKRRVVERLRRDRARATRAAKVRIRPMSAPGTVETTRVVNATAAGVSGEHPTVSDAARARASMSLLPIRTQRP